MKATRSDTMAALRKHYGCGPVELTGTSDGLFERQPLVDTALGGHA